MRLAAVLSVSRVGSAFVFMTFKQGAEMDLAYREVRDRVERARPQLPDDVDQVFIRKDDGSGIPVLVIGMAIGTIFTLFVVPALYLILGHADHASTTEPAEFEEPIETESNERERELMLA